MGERGLLAKKAKWGHLSGGLQRSTERRRSREKTKILCFFPKMGWRRVEERYSKMFLLCNNLCLYTGCWIVVILFFHVVDDDVDVDVDDPSQETEAKRTVAPGVDLHSQFSSCYCLTIPAVASKTSQVSRSPMIPEVPSAWQSLQDSQYCTTISTVASKYHTRVARPPQYQKSLKIFNILFRPKLPFIRSQNWQYSLLWKTRFPGAEEYFYYHPTFLATIYRNAVVLTFYLNGQEGKARENTPKISPHLYFRQYPYVKVIFLLIMYFPCNHGISRTTACPVKFSNGHIVLYCIVLRAW